MTRDPDRAAPCTDPSCSGIAEPEQDGDVTFHQCGTCGYTFGFRRTSLSVRTAESAHACAVGVPEGIRRAASAPMRHSLAAAQPGPLLTIGKRPDATA